MTRRLAKSDISQKRVLDAAAKIFRDFGYAGTTMRAIAKEADLKAGSIYYYYASKDELIRAVLETAMTTLMDRVSTALAALPEGASGRDKIETAIGAHLSAILDVGDYTLATRRVAEQAPEAIRTKNRALRAAYGAIWQSILTEAQGRGEFRGAANPTLARLFITGALNWTVEWFKPGGRTVEEVAHEFSALILGGLVDREERVAATVAVMPRARAERKAQASSASRA